jgi:hypothetical protein
LVVLVIIDGSLIVGAEFPPTLPQPPSVVTTTAVRMAAAEAITRGAGRRFSTGPTVTSGHFAAGQLAR